MNKSLSKRVKVIFLANDIKKILSMGYLTRYYSKLSQLFKFIGIKFVKLKEGFLSFLISLFIGFFFGNLFGTVVDSIRKVNIADSFLIFIILLLNEFINFNIYSKKNKPTISMEIRSKKLSILNAFKVGFLLGIFIDSFKVGS